MLNAVWVAVIVAVAFWAVAVCIAVYVMLKAGRLITETTSAVADLRGRGDMLMDRADAATRRADEQVAKTEAITASMDEVAATMAELNSRLTALAPAARTIAHRVGGPLARVAALLYGISRALGMRRPKVIRAGGPTARAGAIATAQGSAPDGRRRALNGRRQPLGRRPPELNARRGARR